METESQIISRPALPSLSATAAVAGSAQGLVQTDVQVVTIVERRSNKMKIRRVGGWVGNVGQRDDLQKPLRDGIDGQPGILQDIARDRLSVVGIDQLNSRHSRKVATALVGRGYKGEGIIG